MATLNIISFIFLAGSQQEFDTRGSGLWSGITGSQTYNCNGVLLTGGYNVFGGTSSATRTFILPSHTHLSITVDLYMIDSWDNERAIVMIDGITRIDVFYDFRSGNPNICGDSKWGENINNE